MGKDPPISRRLLRHVQRNTIAYLALFVSLAGTSYAAFKLPADSVGAKQIRNHSIDPIKLDPAFIGGSVRHWASVGRDGKVLASSGHVAGGLGNLGKGQLNWGTRFSARCIALATVQSPSNLRVPGTGGFVDASVIPEANNPTEVWISTFNTAGQPVPEPFYVAVVCPPGSR